MQTIDNQALESVHGGGAASSIGHAVGFGGGVAVTAGLALVPGWNKQVPGQPPGFQERHNAVAGPWISRFAAKLPDGSPIQNFTAGMGAGATEAPGWSFRHGI